MDYIDCHVAQKIRLRRLFLGFSQEVIGKALGISIQQIQKYEKGINRVSSANLYRIAKILDVPISYFFESIDENIPRDAYVATLDNNFRLVMDEKETFVLIRAYNNIMCMQSKKKILELMAVLSDKAD